MNAAQEYNKLDVWPT